MISTFLQRFPRAGLVLALAGGLTAGCLPAGSQSEGAVPPEKDSVEIVIQDGVQIYRTTIFAPDPCFKVPIAATITEIGDTLKVERELIREPGICAAVMSPLTVTGPVPAVKAGATQFQLVLKRDNGMLAFQAETPLP